MLIKSFRVLQLALFLSIVLLPALAQDSITIGFVLDGPWERNQQVRDRLETRIEQSVGESKVQFPVAKRLTGNWTRESVSSSLNRLLEDPEVDIVITLGLLGSHEAATRGPLPKPTIASRVVGGEALGIPSRPSPDGRVSGVSNLTYVTLGDLDIRRSVAEFQRIRPFRKAILLVSEVFQELAPNLEELTRKELIESGIPSPEVLFVGKSVATTLSRIGPDSDAVILTLLPQLDPEDYSLLLGALVSRQLPVFSVGGNIFAQMGALAGWGPADSVEEISSRVASNISRILSGVKPEDLAVELNVQPRMAINVETAGALGLSPAQDWSEALLIMETLGVSAASPSMAGIPDQPSQEDRRGSRRGDTSLEMSKLVAEVNQSITRLSNFSAFDAINPKVVSSNEVVLLGYCFRPSLKSDIEIVLKKIKGVEKVRNEIELLPPSTKDDEIRINVFKAIYTHPSMQRYLPGVNSIPDLQVGVDGVDFPRGPHPIHILVKRGNVALIGKVSSTAHRRIADAQAKLVPGIVSVETYLKVSGS